MAQEYRFIKEEILGYSRLKPCSLAVAEEAFSRLPALHCHGLAFVPYLRLAEGTGIVIRDPRRVWEAGITEQEWLEAARENDRSRTPVLKSLTVVLREELPPSAADVQPETSLYFFSYADAPYGSTVLLNPQALGAAAESLERKKLTLLPSSTHELLIAPEHLSPRELQAAVYEINRMGVVTPGEMLSDCIYRYDPLKKEMERFDGICWQADVMERKYTQNRIYERKRPDDHEMEF